MAFRIELISGLSHTYNGRTVRKSQPHVIEKPSEVAYYQMQPDFLVTNLDKTEITKPAPVLKPVPTVDADPIKPAAVSKKSPRKDEPKKKSGSKKQNNLAYSEEALKAMKKSEVLAIATREFGLLLDGDEKKSHIIGLIMDEQINELEGDEEGELEDGDGE